ncbi:MAG: hypothetical protein JNM24_12045 [Bdellovibrionaceae bacterium]|nr:hypothetical protein [Pseudobdellovibrionaceae bacterium]
MKNDNQNIMAIGGILAVIVFVGLCVKMITKIMEHLYRAFYVFKFMLQEFFYVLIEFGKIAIMVVGVGGIIFAAIYFSYRYYKMVRRGTAMQETFDNNYISFVREVKNQLLVHQKEIRAELIEMDQKIRDAIDRPALVPEKIELVAESENIVTATTVDDTGEQSVDDSKTKASAQEQYIKDPQDFINPY